MAMDRKDMHAYYSDMVIGLEYPIAISGLA